MSATDWMVLAYVAVMALVAFAPELDVTWRWPFMRRARW